MVLELHILGPAFGLPSIDAQCLAAVAYMQLAIGAPKSRPKADSQDSQDSSRAEEDNTGEGVEWVLVAEIDTGVVPTNELPALWTGAYWVSGFRKIIQFLSQYSGGSWDLNRWMNPSQKAECTAYSCFLESTAQPLIDLSLYVSSENFNNATHPAYNEFLQWPNTWLIPPKIRAVAKKRTEHLGLSSLDVDETQETERRSARADATGSSLSNTLADSHASKAANSFLLNDRPRTRIRLREMTEQLFQPLNQLVDIRLREGQTFLLGRQLSSLDCLALAYFSLALIPDLPFPWLRDDFMQITTAFTGYTETLRRRCFGDEPETVESALMTAADSSADTSSILPWVSSQRGNRVTDIARQVVGDMLDSIPVVGDYLSYRRQARIAEARLQDGGEEAAAVSGVLRARQRELVTGVASVVGGLVLFAGYMVGTGIITFSKSDRDDDDDDETQITGDIVSTSA